MNIPILQQLQALASTNGFNIVDDLGGYASAIVGLLLVVASLAAFGFLVWGGIRWVTAGPDKNRVEEAKSTLTNAVIGLTIVAASWAAFLILSYFFGLGIVGGTTGSSSNSNTTRTGPPPGYCLCGNGECAASNTLGKRGNGTSTCYTCIGSTGQWLPDRTGNITCPDVINCDPCPR